MTNDEKLEICRRCAGAFMKHIRRNETEFDELANAGFVGMTSDEKKLAFCQAYLHMANFIRRKLNTHPDIRMTRVVSKTSVDDIIDLRAALKTLSSDEMAIITYRFFDGMTLKEMGKQLGMSLQSVHVKLDKLLVKLKTMLEK